MWKLFRSRQATTARHSRLILAVLVGLCAIPLLGWAWLPSQWLFFVCTSACFQGILIYGNLRQNNGWFGPVVKSFRTGRREIWLTIDDGPDPAETPRTLKLLREFNAKATFFVIGTQVLAYPEMARAILQEGHGLANHSATHPASRFWSVSKRTAAKEIRDGSLAIETATGVVSNLFRAPVGMANYFVHQAVREQSKILIGWSSSGNDTLEARESSIEAKIFRSVRPGAIVLMHETHLRPGDPVDRHVVMERVLTRLKQEGYECVIPTNEQFCSCRK
jgi:peptidoglycan-N-acetylglucosamine deacetylase